MLKPRCCVIADDLTGANATGVLLRNEGLRTCTVLNFDTGSDQALQEFDAVTVPTDSRALAAAEAYERVRNATANFDPEGVELFNKRIDSTLRGNIGREIDAMLDALTPPRTAVVVPVFPQAGRICAGDYLLVNGVLLEHTDAARDPKMPVRSSRPTEIVASQTRRRVGHIGLETVAAGQSAVAKALSGAVNGGCEMVVVDSLTDEDLRTVAAGVLESTLPYIAADPGPFTAALIRAILARDGIRHAATGGRHSDRSRARVLMCVGSVTGMTGEQLRHTFDSLDVAYAFLRVEELLGAAPDSTRDRHDSPTPGDPKAPDSRAQQEILRVADGLAGLADRHTVLCVSTNRLDLSQTIDLGAEARKRDTNAEILSDRINRAVAAVGEHILDKVPSIGGIFSSGGDITVALCRAGGAEGISLRHEVLPLAASGRLRGGRHHGTYIVSKGGMVGGRDATTQCVNSLLEAVSEDREELREHTG